MNKPKDHTYSMPTRQPRGRTAIWQARLALLMMINLAQLWILSAAVDAGLAHNYRQIWPLILASGICWLIALSIIVWWRPIDLK